MKKVFNLSIILAVLASALTFSSCSKDEDGPEIEAMAMGGSVVGTVKSEAGLKSATLERDGKTVTPGWPITDFGAGKAVSGSAKDGYIIAISGLIDGKYVLIVVDKNDRKDSFEFEVGSGIVPPINRWENAPDKIDVASGKDYECKQGNFEYDIEIVSASGASITLKLDGTQVTLSDAGTSYISQAGAGLTKAQADAAPSTVLFAKLTGVATLSTVTANVANPIAGAAKTVFLAVE